jgi:transposase
MNRRYPSDISREEFKVIEPILESVSFKTKPRTVDLYDIFCGILYILKGGCQWRMLPSDFPKWQSCYRYFCKWNKASEETGFSTLDVVLKKIGYHGSTKPWQRERD